MMEDDTHAALGSLLPTKFFDQFQISLSRSLGEGGQGPGEGQEPT